MVDFIFDKDIILKTADLLVEYLVRAYTHTMNGVGPNSSLTLYARVLAHRNTPQTTG